MDVDFIRCVHSFIFTGGGILRGGWYLTFITVIVVFSASFPAGHFFPSGVVIFSSSKNGSGVPREDYLSFC